MPTTEDDLALLRALAGPDAVLRGDQEQAIDLLADECRSVLLVQATGWGKSAVYWLAAMRRRRAGWGPALVVSPLLALMRNQVDAAVSAGIAAVTINSTNRDAWAEIDARLADDTVDVLLISPERLNHPAFRTHLRRLAGRLGLLVIDEAHCISAWGHDFRPDYRRIATVLAGLPEGTPVLAATATANATTQADVAAQVGTHTVQLRGTLDRPSLHLGVVGRLDPADRLAWLAEFALAHSESGVGILYTLTVTAAESLAEWLSSQGVRCAAYSGGLGAEERLLVEARLDAGDLHCVVATSALGMGYDNPRIAWVLNVGVPPSVTAYYQQVGRAGRRLEIAHGIVVPTESDRAVWDWMDSTAMPGEQLTHEVLDRLGKLYAEGGPVGITALEPQVNLSRSRLDTLLKILDVEGAVERVEGGWRPTGAPFTYDRDRHERVAAARWADREQMVEYLGTHRCRMRFLRDALDDPHPEDCGRCDSCTGERIDTSAPPATRAAAMEFLRSATHRLVPRKQWPPGVADKRTIPVGLRCAEGRALQAGGNPGWGALIDAALQADAPSDELFHAVTAVLRAWDWDKRPVAVTWVPSRRHEGLLAELAARLADAGGLQLVHAFEDSDPHRPPMAHLHNSSQQAAAARSALHLRAGTAEHLPRGPILLLDDQRDSGWTMTVAGTLLRGAGSGEVLPFVLRAR